MKRRVFLTAAGAVVMLGLKGCGSDDGEKFLGVWQNETWGAGTPLMTIERNGEAFQIEVKRGPNQLDFGGVENLVGTLSEGMILLSTGQRIAYNEKTKSLFIGSSEYKKVQK